MSVSSHITYPSPIINKTNHVYNQNIIYLSMFRNLDDPTYRLSATKDQCEYLSDILPAKYSLVQIRTRDGKNQMTIEELRFWEQGGCYDFGLKNVVRREKKEEERDGRVSTDGVKSVSEKEMQQGEYEDQRSFEVMIQKLKREDEERLGKDEESGFILEETFMLVEELYMIGPNFEIEAKPITESQKLLTKTTNADVIQMQPDSRIDYSNNSNIRKKKPFVIVPFVENTKGRRRERQNHKKKRVLFSPMASIQTINPQNRPIEEHRFTASEFPKTLELPLHTSFAQKHTRYLTSQQKQYLKILSQAKEDKYQQLFQKPLSAADLVNFGQSLVEGKRMSLAIIQSNIRSGKYESIDQLHQDLLLVWLVSYSFKSVEQTVSITPRSTVANSIHEAERRPSMVEEHDKNQEVFHAPITASPTQKAKQTNLSFETKRKLAQDMRMLGPQHQMELWNIVTEGMERNVYDVTIDLETIDSGMLDKLIKYVAESLGERETRRN